MAGHIHPRKLPSKYYKVIGQVIVGWNLTEVFIASIIWHIFHIGKDVTKGRTLIYRQTAFEKLKILSVSAKNFIKVPTIQKELTVLSRRAYAMNDKRNLLAHGFWGRMPNDNVWKIFSIKDSDETTLLLKRKEMTVNDVRQLAQEVRVLNSDPKKFMTRNHIPPP